MDNGPGPQAGWWQASDGRWYPPDQHPDHGHRERFAQRTLAPQPARQHLPAVPVAPAPANLVAAVIPTQPQQQLNIAVQVPTANRSVRPFFFDGGAGTYLGTGILAALITMLTAGIAFPFALVLRERWKAKHTYIEGRRLMFTGTGFGLFGTWLKWLLLMLITLGVYSFWVAPRLVKWKVEHQEFDPRG